MESGRKRWLQFLGIGLLIGWGIGMVPAGAMAFYPPDYLLNPPNSSRGQPPPPPPPAGTPPGDHNPPPGGPPEEEHFPEPATLISGLLGAGMISLFALGRRKKENPLPAAPAA